MGVAGKIMRIPKRKPAIFKLVDAKGFPGKELADNINPLGFMGNAPGSIAQIRSRTPGNTVADQKIVDSKVTIAKVVSDGPGWLVIHAQSDGKAGPVLGYSPVTDGFNADVTVEIDIANAAETLYAMLHTDAGELGAYQS